MKFKALALACAFLAGNASANILLDFNGVGNGASVNDYYNGGTDSLGNTGINYGIQFSGGTVINGVVTGPFSVAFAPTNNVTRVDFLMSQRLAEQTDISYFSTTLAKEVLHVDFTPSSLGLVSNRITPPVGLYQINFALSQLDNLAFTSATWNGPVGDPVTGTVPEPGSIALLGLGALGLFGAYRRKSASNKNA